MDSLCDLQSEESLEPHGYRKGSLCTERLELNQLDQKAMGAAVEADCDWCT